MRQVDVIRSCDEMAGLVANVSELVRREEHRRMAPQVRALEVRVPVRCERPDTPVCQLCPVAPDGGSARSGRRSHAWVRRGYLSGCGLHAALVRDVDDDVAVLVASPVVAADAEAHLLVLATPTALLPTRHEAQHMGAEPFRFGIAWAETDGAPRPARSSGSRGGRRACRICDIRPRRSPGRGGTDASQATLAAAR
jgi:hypothetical protein